MSKKDILRIPDYLGHIVEAIYRSHALAWECVGNAPALSNATLERPCLRPHAEARERCEFFTEE